jgi:hypothetical protein
LAPGAALRRAIAQFHGLLRTGGNRKIACWKSLFVGKALGNTDLAGGIALIIRRLIVPLTVAVVTAAGGQALTQGALPAPPPGQAAPSAAPIAGSAFEGGPASPSQAVVSGECTKEFVPLRVEAEQRGKLIKAASAQHAPAAEACKLIENFGQAEIKMIRYVQTNASRCGIPPQISDQLMSGHRNTESMQKKVCAVAQQQQQRGPAGPLGDYLILPEKQL